MPTLALPRWSALLPYLEFYIYLFFLALKKSYKVDNKVKSQQGWGSRDRDRMVHNYLPITTNLASSSPAHGEVYSIQHYVIQFVSDLRQVDGFLQTDRHDIIEILLKVALNTITLYIISLRSVEKII
jgi:hypothetical protein